MSQDVVIDPPPLYTSSQANLLAILPYVSAPFSVAGSALILWSILFEYKTLLRHHVYHRFLLCMSLADFCNSMGMLVLGHWAVPREWPYSGQTSNRGTIATCEAAGFSLNLITITMWYSVFLAIYFVLLLRWEWKERQVMTFVTLHTMLCHVS